MLTYQGVIPLLVPSDGALKAGQSVFELIGTSDCNGWMWERGEEHNSWRMRYFVLKGLHLYCLRSNENTVRRTFAR